MSVEEQTRAPGDPRALPPRSAHGYPSARYYRRVALGTLLPGGGLIGTRYRVLGWVLLSAALVGVAVVLARSWRAGVLRSALDVAVQPVLLQRVGVGLMIGAVLWIGSIVLTAQQAWPTGHPGAGLRLAVAAGACLVVAAPTMIAVRLLDVQATVIDTVFVNDAPPGETFAPSGVQAQARDPWADVPRVNTLLIGSDAGQGRWGTRTDSLMLVSTDTVSGDTLLIGIPRNLERVPFPDSNPLSGLYPTGYDCGDECLMNGIWTLAEGRPDLFPGVASPGRQSTIDVVGEITGLPVDHSVVVNLKGFSSLVDAMGGVDVTVQQRVCVGCSERSDGSIRWSTGVKEWIEVGPQRLDGRGALWYARSRAGSDDFSRMRRQRCVAGALLEQSRPTSLLANYSDLAQVVTDNVSIDIPRSDLTAWVDLVTRIQDGGSIRSLPLTSSVLNPANPDFDEIRSLVQTSLTPPTPTPTPTPSAPDAVGTSPTASPMPTSGGEPSPSPTPTVADSDAAPLAATC